MVSALAYGLKIGSLAGYPARAEKRIQSDMAKFNKLAVETRIELE